MKSNNSLNDIINSAEKTSVSESIKDIKKYKNVVAKVIEDEENHRRFRIFAINTDENKDNIGGKMNNIEISKLIDSKIETNNKKLLKMIDSKIEEKIEANNKKLLKMIDSKIEEKIEANNEKLLNHMQMMIDNLANTFSSILKKEINGLETRLNKRIDRVVNVIKELHPNQKINL